MLNPCQSSAPMLAQFMLKANKDVFSPSEISGTFKLFVIALGGKNKEMLLCWKK